MRQRRETVEHPFGTLNEDGGHAFPDEDAAAGRLRDGASRIGLLTRVMNITGIQPLMAAMRA
jgi:hypothetical protein